MIIIINQAMDIFHDQAQSDSRPVASNDHDGHTADASRETIEFVLGVRINHEYTDAVGFQYTDQIGDWVKAQIPCLADALGNLFGLIHRGNGRDQSLGRGKSLDRRLRE